MKKTIEQLHIAAQYLSAIGINYVEKQADDSHTNLGWDTYNKRLITYAFGNGNLQVGLNFNTGNLEWIKNDKVRETLNIEDSTHFSNLTWFNKQADNYGLAAYEYKFHYELPYEKIKADHVFNFNTKNVDEISSRISTAQSVFEKLLLSQQLISPIRVWSHHFDIGIYSQLDHSGELFLGAGLAIPDTLVDDMYFYASGWKNGLAVEPKNFTGLKSGQWRSDWQGATLASTGTSVEQAILFFSQTIATFKANV